MSQRRLIKHAPGSTSSFARLKRLGAILGGLATGLTTVGGVVYSAMEYGRSLAARDNMAISEQLELVERRHSAELAEMSTELRAARADASRAHADMERLTGELAVARDQASRSDRDLGTKTSEADRLQRKLAQLEEEGLKNRPFLEITYDDSRAPSTVVAIAKNRDERAIRIVRSRGLVWLDGVQGTEDSEAQVLVLRPGETNTVRSFNVSGDLARIRDGSQRYRAAACLVYEDATGSVPGGWIVEHWFEYNPQRRNGHALSFWRRDDRRVSARDLDCNLDQLMPPGWTDFR